jgi:hypothetical protein
MALKNCARCGRAFHGDTWALCPECLEAEQEDFDNVRQFIKDNPKVSIEVVAEATGVDEDRIREFLKQGRIDVAELQGPLLECKRCGKPIYQGEYCVLCQGEVSKMFRSSDKESKGRASKRAESSSFARRYRRRD